MSDRSPLLSQVMLRAVEAGLARTHVALPAKITKFDSATQLASVQPYLKETHENEDGEEVSAALKVINGVPVQFPGGGDFVITFPVAVGDPCWLVFSDRSLDVWKEKGGIVDPVHLHNHHISDAVAMLGVRSKAGALAEFDTGAVRLGKVGGTGIRIKTGEVHLGVGHNEDAANFVALANLVKSEIDALRSYVSSHVHVTSCGAGPGTAAAPVLPPPIVGEVAATKVKAK
jgi:hypothetical protein